MAAKRPILIGVGCGVVMASLCLLAGIGLLARWQKMTSCYNARLPLRGIVVFLPSTDQQAHLFEQLEKFADENGLTYSIAATTPSGEDFIVDMTRRDIDMIANNPFSPTEFKITFYNNDCIHPTLESDPELDALLAALTRHLREIPGVTITGIE